MVSQYFQSHAFRKWPQDINTGGDVTRSTCCVQFTSGAALGGSAVAVLKFEKIEETSRQLEENPVKFFLSLNCCG